LRYEQADFRARTLPDAECKCNNEIQEQPSLITPHVMRAFFPGFVLPAKEMHHVRIMSASKHLNGYDRSANMAAAKSKVFAESASLRYQS
jgi:hypothetical protein